MQLAIFRDPCLLPLCWSDATMRLLIAALLFVGFDSVHCADFVAPLNMEGVTGLVSFNSTSRAVLVNISGAGSCSSVNFSLSEFPVMYGHFKDPCSEANIGPSIFTFQADPSQTNSIDVSLLFRQRSNLDDLSLSLLTCNGTKVCTVVSQSQTNVTLQARFTGSISGNIYLRLNLNNSNSRLLADLAAVESSTSETNVTLFGSLSTAPSCDVLLGSIAPSALRKLGVVKVGLPLFPQKSRLDLDSFNSSYKFLLYSIGSVYKCAQIYNLPVKQVRAVVNMRGIKGYFGFFQASPFDLTRITVNITNLNQVGPYHVHQFPVPNSIGSGLCSNDNVGGHWNPFGIDTMSPSYPKGPGSTHDKYEIGDLSNKHESLKDKSMMMKTFTDFNLPLFGQNSIVGRSVVIHSQTDNARFACASIGYPAEVTVAKAMFQSLVVGEVWFTQVVNNPLSDVSIFMNLSYGNPSMTESQRHNWHVHTFPISSERDDDEQRCSTTGGHWNPFQITVNSNYAVNCAPLSPFSCEVGDFANKHSTINLSAKVGSVDSKHFFTDVTAWVPGMIGRSVVIHEAGRGAPRIACANITEVRVPKAILGPWFGLGSIDGQVQFSQAVPQGPTTIQVFLKNLAFIAGGYHVHMLPLKPGSASPCSNADILGHFNPLAWNVSNSPSPGVGTVDQYEVGDISGKFGMLTLKDIFEGVHEDPSMPLTGPYSIVGRSLVIHHTNSTRLRCADIVANTSTGGQLINSTAVFNGVVNGTVQLRQQMFADGSSSDVTLVVDLQPTTRANLEQASLFITSNRLNGSLCNSVGATFNPFNMTLKSSSCSLGNPLSCAVGEISARQGNVSLNQRQVFSDSLIQLSGDNTVVHRSLVLKDGDTIIACADILPNSPSSEQIFPKVTNFSRFDFRKRVADVLKVETARVTILPGSPFNVEGRSCQRVTYMVSGEVSAALLSSVRTSDAMGVFKESNLCTKATGNAGLLLLPGQLLLVLMFSIAVLLPSAA